MDKRGFLRITLFDTNDDFDVEEAMLQIEAGMKITQGRKSLVLVDLRKSRHIPSIEVKKILAETEKYKIAEALLIESLHQRILGNFYIKITANINKEQPRKIFTCEQKAINWLLMHKNEYGNIN